MRGKLQPLFGIFALAALFVASPLMAQELQVMSFNPSVPDSILELVRKELAEEVAIVEEELAEELHISYAVTDLNADQNPDMLIKFANSYHCGLQQCSAFVLFNNGSSWQVLGAVKGVRLAVEVVASGRMNDIVANDGTRFEFLDGQYRIKPSGGLRR